MKTRGCVLTMALLLGLASAAAAATYYWDNNAATAGFGTAGGTWTAPTVSQWSTDSTGASAPGASVTTATGDTLYFGYGANGLGSGAITVSGTVGVDNLYFSKDSSAVTLNGGTIDMSNGNESLIQVNSGTATPGTHTINSNIDKTGGNNIRICTQATTDENFIINGNISGNCGLNPRPQNNGAYVALNGTNTFSGDVALTTGQLNFNSVADSGTACSLGTGSQLSMGGGGGQQPLVWYTGTSAGSMNRTLKLNSTASSRIVAQDGALDLSGSLYGQGTGTYPLYLSGTADSGTNRVSGVISDGSGTVRLQLSDTAPQDGSSEANFWALSGVNTFTGSTTLSDTSHLLIDGPGQLGSGSYAGTISINDTATFEYGSSANQTLTGTIQGSGTGGLVASGSGTLTVPLTNTTSYTGPTTINGGNLQFANTADLKGLSCSQFYINDGGYLEFESSVGGNNRTVLNNKTMTFGSNGGGTIHFNGGNHLFQTGTHTFTTTGGSKNTISHSNGGFINNQTSGNTDFTVADGTDDVDLELSATWSNGPITKNGAGKMSITGTHGGNYAITINAGTLDVGGSSRLAGGTFTSTIANDGIFQHSSDQLQTISGNITGSGALVKTNGTALTLSGANTYSGTTTVGATLNADSTTALSTNSAFTVNSSGNLILNANDSEIASLSGAGTVKNEAVASATAATLTMGRDNSTTTFSGALIDGPGGSGALSLTKTGTGTNTLSGANTYTGATTVNDGLLTVSGGGSIIGTTNAITQSGGALTVSNATVTLGSSASGVFGVGYGATGTGTATVDNGGVLNVGTGGGRTFIGGGPSGGTMGTGVLNINAGGIVNVASAGAFPNDRIYLAGYGGNGTLNFNGGELQTARSFGNGGTYAINLLAGGGTINDLGNSITLGLAVGGSGSLTKLGSGTLTLSAANSYSGGTTFGSTDDGGTIEVGDSSALGSGSVVFSKGGTLALGADGLNVANSIYLYNWGGGIRTLRLDLSGTNTGELSGNQDNRVMTSKWIMADVGADDTLTLSGTLSTGAGGGAGYTKIGDGTLVMSGNNTYLGTTTISNGILKITSATALGNTSQGTVVEDGGTLELGQSGAISEPVTINGAGEGGIGAIYTSGGNADTASTLTLGADATIGGTARMDHSGETTDGGNGYTLTKTGSFDFLPSGAANYSHLVINQGSVTLTGDSGLPGAPGRVTVNSGTTLTTWSHRTIANSPNITLNDGSVFNTARSVDDTMSINGTFTLNGNTTFRNSRMTSTIDSIIGGTGNLAIEDGGPTTGMFIFTGANTYTGDTTIDGVPLQISGTGVLGSGNYAGAIVMNNALTYSSSADQTLSGNITGGANTLTKDTSAASTLTLTGTSILEDLAVSAGTVDIAGGTLTVTGVTVAASSTLELTGGTLDLTPVALSSNSLQINGGGVVEISGGTHDLYGRIYNYGTFRVVGNAATIAIQQISDQSGAFEFVLDSDGVSGMSSGSWIQFGNATVDVDGTAYTGGDQSFHLFEANDLNILCPEGNVNITGFDSKYLVRVDQDQGIDKVTLVINDLTPEPSLFKFK
jgi:fibronectin-binding autotransporter adhesin